LVPARLRPAPRRGAAGKRSLGVFDGDMTCPGARRRRRRRRCAPHASEHTGAGGRWRRGEGGRRDRRPKGEAVVEDRPRPPSPRLRVRVLMSGARRASHPDVIQTGSGRRAFHQMGCLSGSIGEQRGAGCDTGVTAGPGGDGPSVRPCRSLPNVGRYGAPHRRAAVGPLINGCGKADAPNIVLYQLAGMRFLIALADAQMYISFCQR
jgi:hypothetical protein